MSLTTKNNIKCTVKNVSDVQGLVLKTEKSNTTAIIRTALAFIVSPSGNKKLCRVILDSASDTSLIRRDIAKELGLTGEKVWLSIQGAMNSNATSCSEMVTTFKLLSSEKDFLSQNIEAITVKSVANALPALNIDVSHYQHLNGHKFSDPPSNKEREVHLLLGEPYYSRIVTGCTVNGPIGSPGLQHSFLGKLLVGSFNNCVIQRTVFVANKKVQNDLKDNLDFLWRLETMHIFPSETMLTLEEVKALDLMKKVTRVDKEKGQYVTRLLWKEKPEGKLNDNYAKCLAVIRSVIRRNKFKPVERELIDSAFNTLLTDKFVEIVPRNEYVKKKGFVYYLEVLPVFRKNATTTKVRLCFNASSKNDIGCSLNDFLYVGPCLIPDLASVSLRFKWFKHALKVDLSKMFLRLLLEKGDTEDELRILWPGFEADSPFLVLRLLTSAFGINSSPFQNIFIVKDAADRFVKMYPEYQTFVQDIVNALYLDDTPLSVPSVDYGTLLVRVMREIFRMAGMFCHKFNSSNLKILEEVPESELESECQTSVLGTQWNTKSDTMSLKPVELPDLSSEHTKRSLLRVASSIYDLEGKCAPFVLGFKVLLQELWARKLDWEDQLPEDILVRYKELLKDLPVMNAFTFPRHIGFIPGCQVWLAAFSDGSDVGFAGIIFIRLQYPNGEVGTKSILAKSRVAPKKMFESKKCKDDKELTIARKELLGLVLTCQLVSSLCSSLNLPFEKVTIFTDSLVNLYRINKKADLQKQWVAERLLKCLENLSQEQFNYVSSEMNPADLCCKPNSMSVVLSDFFQKGPNFLLSSPSQWKTQAPSRSPQEEKTILKEMRAIEPTVLIVSQLSNEWKDLFEKHERWSKVSKILAYVLRFVNRIKQKIAQPKWEWRSRVLTPGEIMKAEKLWLIWAQQECFPKDYSLLLEGKEVTKESKLRQHMPFIRDEAILCYSRVQGADEIQSSTPLLLVKHIFVSKFIFFMHLLMNHPPLETLLAELRRKFVVLGGRRTIKMIIHKHCKAMSCRRIVPISVRLASLPSFRFTQHTPFLYTMVDHAGDFKLKHKCERKDCVHETFPKAYICVFTCMITRAVHLEVCPDLSSQQTLNCIYRMQSRRGKSAFLYSDNGKAFVGCKNALEKLSLIDNENIAQELAAERVEWVFGVPLSPQHQALVEICVKIVKKALYKVFKTCQLSYLEFTDVVHRAEMVVNARPLSYRIDQDSIVPITPGELVVNRVLFDNEHYEGKVNKKTPKILAQFKHRQDLMKQFWSRLYRDYYSNLSATRLWQTDTTDNIKVGDVCLLFVPNQQINKHTLCRILELSSNRDNRTATATVQLGDEKRTELKRSIRFLSLFEEGERTSE